MYCLIKEQLKKTWIRNPANNNPPLNSLPFLSQDIYLHVENTTYQKVLLLLPAEEGPDEAVGEVAPGQARYGGPDTVQQVRGVHRVQVQQLQQREKCQNYSTPQISAVL